MNSRIKKIYIYHVDEIESFAKVITSCVSVVKMQSIGDVLNETRDSCLSLLFALDHCSTHTLGYHSYFAFFPLLPHPMGNVEENALEEEHEWYPLIIRVVPFFSNVSAETRMSDVSANRLVLIRWQSKRVCDPAKSVDHVIRYSSVRYTVYGITWE